VAERAVAELRGVGLADDHCAGRAQALDDDVVLVGQVVGVEARAEGRAQAARADQVLDRDRHAGERASRLAARDPRIDGARGGARAIRVERAEGVQAIVERGDARQRVVEHRLGGHPSARHRVHDRCKRPGCGAVTAVVRIGHGAFRFIRTATAKRLPV
jgi:hypothetical protein